MNFPWALAIGLGILGLAFLIKHFVEKTVEEEKPFLIVIGIFLIIYVLAAIAINYLNPLHLTSSLSS